ncbi:MAG: hypothetical protein AAF405_10075, partial [Pseudomonadota bacterium]
MTKLRPFPALLLLLGCAAPMFGAHAEPLEKKECAQLRAQLKTLATSTVQTALRRGPDWVKDNLHDHEKIEQVREYLVVEEKIAFRCRVHSLKIPKREPPSRPDRKPKVPVYIVAGVAATSLIPLRNPSRDANDAIAASLTSEDVPEDTAEGDIDPAADLDRAADITPDAPVASVAPT